MERSEVQKLHIKMSKYQYGISLFLAKKNKLIVKI